MKHKVGDKVRIIKWHGGLLHFNDVLEIKELRAKSYLVSSKYAEVWIRDEHCEAIVPPAKLLMTNSYLHKRKTTPPEAQHICEHCRYITDKRLGEEAFVIIVHFTSSGDTSKYTDEEIIVAIGKKVKTIEL